MPAVPQRKNIVTRRPAESSTGLAGVVAGVIVLVFHVKNPNVVGPLTIAIGSVPAIITYVTDWWIKVRDARKPSAAT